MRAREMAEQLPTIGPESDAMAAASLLAEHRVPGLVVTDEIGAPYAVLPGSQVLRFLIPAYVQDDPQLAAVYDEQAADELCRRLEGRRVADLLPKRQDVDDLPVVEGEASSIEIAATMARLRSPIVAVVDGGRYVGAITVSRLLRYVLAERQE